MPVNILTGLTDTADISQDEKVVDMSDTISMLHDQTDQFFVILNRLPRREARGEKVNWLEDQLMPIFTTTAASGTSSATSVSVATGTGSYFSANDLFRVPSTGEMMRVVSVSGDTLTVERGIGTVAAASFANGAEIVKVNNVFAQGATMGVSKMTKKVLGYNYTQITRTAFRFTNTAIWIQRYGESEPGREAAKKLIEHRRLIENTCFWGARMFNTSGSEPVGSAGGLDEFISTNVHSVGGTLTNSLMDGYLRQDLQNCTNPAIFASPLFAQSVSNMLRTIWSPPSTDERVYGAKVDYWLDSAYGSRIPIFVKRDWNSYSASNNGYGSRAYVVDMANVRLRPAPGRFVVKLDNRQANDADERAMEYLSEFSLEVRQESHHARIQGVTG